MTVGMKHPMVCAFERDFRRLRIAQTLALLAGVAAFVGVLTVSADIAGADPARILAGLPRIGEYFAETIPVIRIGTFFADIAAWYGDFWTWLGLLLDTLLICVAATFVGVIGGGLSSFPASRNLIRAYGVYFASRRLMEIARTVPELVYALIFVVAFGVGPLAGVLALGVHSIGALGKLFAEVNENIDHHQVDGVRATGANWVETMRFAVLPQVLPGFTTYTLWRLELNLRAAAIVGFVGAGGIGQELYKAVSWNNYTDVSALLLLIVVTVVVIDLLSERIRHRIIGRENLT